MDFLTPIKNSRNIMILRNIMGKVFHQVSHDPRRFIIIFHCLQRIYWVDLFEKHRTRLLVVIKHANRSLSFKGKQGLTFTGNLSLWMTNLEHHFFAIGSSRRRNIIGIHFRKRFQDGNSIYIFTSFNKFWKTINPGLSVCSPAIDRHFLKF